jgi:zinc protease
MRDELKRALADGFTAAELEDAKKGILESRRLARMNDSSIAAGLADALYYNRTLQWGIDFEEKLKSLTLAQVNDAFRRHIHPDELVIIKAGNFAGASAASDGKAPADTKAPVGIKKP